MKNKSSRKIVAGALISGISLQLIPFNVFAENNLSNTREITTSSIASQSTSLSDSRVTIRGKYVSSNPNKVVMSFDVKEKKILLDVGSSRVNTDYKNQVYATVELFNQSGEKKNSFSLKGNDFPNINDSVKKFNGQTFEFGDYLKITHKEPKNLIVRNGKVDAKKDFSDGVSEDNLNTFLFKITANGLEQVDVADTITPIIKGSYWDDDNSFVIKGTTDSCLGISSKVENKALLIRKQNGEVVKNLNEEKVNTYSKDENNNNGFQAKITKDTLSKIKEGIYNIYVQFTVNGKEYIKALKQEPTKAKYVEEKDINKTGVRDINSLSYEFKTNTKNLVQLEVKDKLSSNSLSNTHLIINGKYVSSNPIKVVMSFDTEDKEIILHTGQSKVNTDYKNEVYTTVELFNKSGKEKNSFSLKGDDFPNINNSVKNFNKQDFDFGDYLRITIKEPKNLIIYNSKVRAKKAFSKGASKDNLNSSLFRITEDGLEQVDVLDTIIPIIKE